LPTVDHPATIEVKTDNNGGLDELNTNNILMDLEFYRGALDKCNAVIEGYNKIKK
jgi:hypothetical protein